MTTTPGATSTSVTSDEAREIVSAERAANTTSGSGFRATSLAHSNSSQATSVEVRDGKVTTTSNSLKGFASASSADQRPSDGGIMSSVKSTFGSVGGKVTRDSVVTLPNGMETSVGNAAKLGYVRENPATGHFEDVGGTDPLEAQVKEQHQQREQEKATSEPVEALDPIAEGFLQEAVSRVGTHDSTAAINAVIDGGTVSADVINRIATQAHQSPAEVSRKIEHLTQSFRTQALDKLGAGFAEVADWARTNKSGELNAAMNEQVHQGTLSGYRALQTHYHEHLDTINPDAILNSKNGRAAGARREPDGSITILHPQVGRIGWRAAVRMGAVLPGRLNG